MCCCRAWLEYDLTMQFEGGLHLFPFTTNTSSTTTSLDLKLLLRPSLLYEDSFKVEE